MTICIPKMNTRRRKTTSKERTCPTCSRQFAKAERLERHLRTHTREKPFQCLVCEKYYSRQYVLTSPRSSLHQILFSPPPSIVF